MIYKTVRPNSRTSVFRRARARGLREGQWWEVPTRNGVLEDLSDLKE